MSKLLPLSEIAFLPPFPNPAPPDAPGEQLQVDLRDLFIDPKYQRPIGARGEKNIRQVIENFSWSLFSPIVVSRRENGTFAVIDGQHRAIAALTHGGIEKVPAYVINGGPSDEAKAFAVINGAVTAILPTQIWHARVVAGDVDAIRLKRVLDAEGVSIPRNARPKALIEKGETAAIDALERSFKLYGGEVLGLALRTVVGTKDGNPGYLRTHLIKATTDVLGAHPEWVAKPKDVIRAIRTVGIEYLWGVAMKKTVDGQRSTLIAAYAAALTRLFKKEIA